MLAKFVLRVEYNVSTASVRLHQQELQPGPDVSVLLIQALRLRTLGSNRMT